MIQISKPYVLFIGSDPRPERSKIAFGAASFIPADCVGYISDQASIKLPNIDAISFETAIENGAKSFVIGSLATRGSIEPEWAPFIAKAMAHGLDIVNGHHERLEDVHIENVGNFSDLAKQHRIKIHNIRHYDGVLPLGTGEQRTGTKILTVGTDCSSGKMMTALSVQLEFEKRAIQSRFVATGQTGILLSGSGIAIDAVVADFISGAVEFLTPDTNEILVIEGQGSLYHPSFAGVSLGLLHGAQADHIIMCHNPTKETMSSVGYPLPELADCLALNLKMGRRTNPSQTCIGISLNTSSMNEQNARSLIHELEAAHQLPVTDPIRFGIAPIVDAFLETHVTPA